MRAPGLRYIKGQHSFEYSECYPRSKSIFFLSVIYPWYSRFRRDAAILRLLVCGEESAQARQAELFVPSSNTEQSM
ncbi:hypothetical protein G7K_0954-t1 [Saitoella complicata NRRL Y-17804]|uniref:Uncharacterized protein n=1 Tax=Saitoella complicata (strain BCRC 22490 / CBS 7301 / JCM 7358 / NBRC 10748 / NRRL Y-17804) TaxID=698492 RepID=A0A0E9NA17_SAICN|nr:hypothetical protein G7K_0954-t1 [Saitoella complicata NRRL Y-17804]